MRRAARTSDAVTVAFAIKALRPQPPAIATIDAAQSVIIGNHDRIRTEMLLVVLSDFRRQHLEVADPSARRADAVARLERLTDDVPALRRCLDRAASRLEADVAQRRARPQKATQSGLARAAMGPPPRGERGRRRDNVQDCFLWSLWHCYVQLSERLPGTSVGAVTSKNAGQAEGPLLRFCEASLAWLKSQIPPELLERDPKLRKAFAASRAAIRARLQRAVDFGTMRHA